MSERRSIYMFKKRACFDGWCEQIQNMGLKRETKKSPDMWFLVTCKCASAAQTNEKGSKWFYSRECWKNNSMPRSHSPYLSLHISQHSAPIIIHVDSPLASSYALPCYICLYFHPNLLKSTSYEYSTTCTWWIHSPQTLNLAKLKRHHHAYWIPSAIWRDCAGNIWEVTIIFYRPAFSMNCKFNDHEPSIINYQSYYV